MRVTRKIPIPVKDHPELNFIGIIIGPRGNTHKRLEEESGARIAIRGRGSVKEGRKKDSHVDDGEDEELHVLITGDTEAAVSKAADMIEHLFKPEWLAHVNEHKRLQLRELAALNGRACSFTDSAVRLYARSLIRPFIDPAMLWLLAWLVLRQLAHLSAG